MKNESLMDRTGLGLLPGLVLALGLIVFATDFLPTGSMWAVFGVLALIVIVTIAVAGISDSSRPLEHN